MERRNEMKEETYEKVFIKTEADLPKENGKYICMIRNINHPALLQYDIQSKGEYGYSKQWLELVDWYLKPAEPVSDADIEKWAKKRLPFLEHAVFSVSQLRDLLYEGAKAMREGKIKKT